MLALRSRSLLRAGIALSTVVLGSAPTLADPWTGFYVGAYAGAAWGASDFDTDAGTVFPGSYFSAVSRIESVRSNAIGSTSSQSFTGGLQVSANERFGQLVAGVEADFGRFSLEGSRGASDVPYPGLSSVYSVHTAVDTDWLVTARGRLGWLALPQLLEPFRVSWKHSRR